ncbi:TRAP transporter large permease [Anaerotruncus rubiinfantis]|uniref:TRAP transporter large permease n=1 Tax=Anaerotruncus rubiinfantis TaxID=1720200 RepID=UPI00189AE427|nr:TRAP transporter large permease [Anaerotruncus rubiinfantis]
MLIVFVVFLVLLILGVPVSLSVGISGVFFFLQHAEMPFNQIVQLTLTNVQSLAFLAVPLFILAGHLMNASGITTRLLGFADVLTGHMRGGMAQSSVVLSTLMGGVSGSSTADAAMESRILGPSMIKAGYPRAFTAVVIGYTSLITSTIPPGINLILYGTTAGISIGRLFMAGLMVGLMMMTALMVTVAVCSRRKGLKPSRDRRASVKELYKSLCGNIWAIIFPILLLVGIRLGLFTATEVGAFACVYALCVGVFAYRMITLQNIWEILENAAVDIAGIMFLVACTGIFSYGIPIDKIPQKITGFMMSLTDSSHMILLMIVICLLIFGMFIDGGIVVLLTTPIFLPLIKQIGVDPVMFGLLLCTVSCMGILTPPVGVAMYIVCDNLKVSLGEWMKESVPFILTVILLMVVIIYFPAAVTWLPELVYG